MHPSFYRGPSLVKPPIVYIAGLLRARNLGINTEDWIWISDTAGMSLFHPPNVSGWDEERWLDTSTFRGRWQAVARILRDDYLPVWGDDYTDASTAQAIARALTYWGNPTLTAQSEKALRAFCDGLPPGPTIAREELFQRFARTPCGC